MHSKWFLVLLIPFSLLMGACSGGSFETSNLPIIGRTDAPTPSVTSTPLPTSTHTPSPTPLPTSKITPTPTPTEPEHTPTPEPIVVENLNHIPEGTIGCIHPDLCYHMTVSPENGKKGMDEAKTAFAESPMLQAFWKEVGVKGPISLETLDEWLEQSVGGPENKPYWVPAESPNGTPFMYLQGRGTARGEFAEGTLVNQNGGFYLDRMTFLAFSYTDWKQDERLSTFVDGMLEENWRHNGPFLGNGGLQNPNIMFGLLVKDNRYVFLVGHERPIETERLWQERMQLGGLSQEFRPDFDPMVMQAYFSTYFGYTGQWWQAERNWEYKNKDILILNILGSETIVNVMSVKESIFEPAEQLE